MVKPSAVGTRSIPHIHTTTSTSSVCHWWFFHYYCLTQQHVVVHIRQQGVQIVVVVRPKQIVTVVLSPGIGGWNGTNGGRTTTTSGTLVGIRRRLGRRRRIGTTSSTVGATTTTTTTTTGHHCRSRRRNRPSFQGIIIIMRRRRRLVQGNGLLCLDDGQRQFCGLFVPRLGTAPRLSQFLERPSSYGAVVVAGAGRCLLKGAVVTIIVVFGLLALPADLRHQSATGENGIFKAFYFVVGVGGGSPGALVSFPDDYYLFRLLWL